MAAWRTWGRPSHCARCRTPREPPAHLYADPGALLLDLALTEYAALEAREIDDAADLARAQAVVRRMAHLAADDA
ncbi:hypothetical protein ACQPXB_08220 [Amycolatopsis sp. CA-161197]|uniref:hypothetical protein n=1 Tax=Amycolatopsis sp. CA-161197 TaxID=3239922 RepID=UPI003D93BEE1